MGNPYEPLSNASDNLKNLEKTENEAPTEDSTDEIPEGNISELKEWVGDDKEKAQLLLDEENSHDNPRKTLVKLLEEVING